MIARLRARLAEEPGASLFLMAVQDQSHVGGRRVAPATNTRCWRTISPRCANARAKIHPRWPHCPSWRTSARISRTKGSGEWIWSTIAKPLARLGISVSDANNLLNNAFGQRAISTIYQPLKPIQSRDGSGAALHQDVSSLGQNVHHQQRRQRDTALYFASWRPA
ncbi:hypothetical protein M8494_02350 [Serratia ureilytica]